MKKVLRSSQVLAVVLVTLALSSVFFGVESAWAADGPEPLSMSTVEDVSILGSGTALVKLSVDVGASSLADMYRELLAAPYDAGVGEVMPIPENETENGGVTPVREEYYRSIKQEQMVSFGFGMRILNSSMVPRDEQNGCKVSVDAVASPQVVSITDVGSDVIFEVVAGPKEENATGAAFGHVLTKVAFAQDMLDSVEGEQVYEVDWTTRIKLPAQAALLNGDELDGLSWVVNFGAGTSMNAFLALDGPSTIVLSERTVVAEQNVTATLGEIFEAFRGYKVFTIRYQLPESALAEGEGLWESAIDRDWSFSWNWRLKFSIPIPFVYPIPGGKIEGTLTVIPTFSFSGYIGFDIDWTPLPELDWFKAWIGIGAELKVTLDATVTVGGEHTWERTLYETTLYTFTFAIGPVPVWADLDFSIITRFTVGAEATVHFWMETTVGASLKAGVKYDNGWSPIWEPNLYADLDGPELFVFASAHAEAFLGGRLSLMIYSVAGPFIEFGPYVSGDITYYAVDEVAVWTVRTGLKVNVGITFCEFLKDLLGLRDYYKPIGDWPIKAWEGHFGQARSDISINDLDPDSIGIGSATMVTGKITSGYPGSKRGSVYIEYRSDGDTWSTAGTAHSNDAGDYSFWWVMWEAGTFYVRSRWEGNSGYKEATTLDTRTLRVSAVVSGPQILLYDDNENPDWFDVPDYPSGMAVCFTPKDLNWKLEKIHVHGGYPLYDADFVVEVWDSDRNELFRGTYKYSEYFPLISLDPVVPMQWAEIDIPDIFVTGDFYIAVSGDPTPRYQLWVSVDTDSSFRRSYRVHMDDHWISSRSVNYMIRAEGKPILGYDPGQTSLFYSPTYPNNGIAVRFTDDTLNFGSLWILDKIYVYGGYAASYDSNFIVEVWDSDLVQRFGKTYRYSDYFRPLVRIEDAEWAVIDIPDIIVPGDFYIAISGMNTMLMVGYDLAWNPPFQYLQSYSVDMEDNSIIDGPYNLNWMIRAEGISAVEDHSMYAWRWVSDGGLPILTSPETDTFYSDDVKIWSWVEFRASIRAIANEVRWVWRRPGGLLAVTVYYTPPDWNGQAYSGLEVEDYRWYFEQYNAFGIPLTVDVYFNGMLAFTETYRVIKHESSVSVALSPDSIAYGQNVQILARTRACYGTITLQYSTDDVSWNNIAIGTPPSPPSPIPIGDWVYFYNWVPLHAGNYRIRAVWSGSLKYAANTSETVTLTVNKAPTLLLTSLSSTEIFVGPNVTITSTLTSPITGTPLQGKNITIQFSNDGSTWHTLGVNTTDSAGQCTYTWAPDVDIYYINCTWYGDDDYLGTNSIVVELTVKPTRATIVEIIIGADAEVDRDPEATVEFGVRVKDAETGQYLTSIGRVEFYVSDQSYYRNKLIGSDNDTDGDGIYHIQWTVNDSWPVLGPQPWGAYFTGTPEYMPNSTSSTFTIYYYGVALWIDPAFQEINVTSTKMHTINFKWNRDTTDTFDLSLTGLDPTWYTLSQTSISVDTKGQVEQVTLTISLPNAPTILKDYEFMVTAISQEDPSFSVSATATLRVRFTPTLPQSPTGDLAVVVQPQIIYTSAGTTTSINILIVNNQNFDDVITVDLRNTGIQLQYQANLTWFNWIRVKVFLPAGASIYIPLQIEVSADTPLGIYDFRAVATSTTDFAIAAEDSGTINAADITPPTTTITFTGTSGLNGWYVSDVTVALTATDDISGVASTEYSFDGANWILYTGPITISNEGTTTIYYRSIDNAGNIEPPKTAILLLDHAPPTTTLTIGEPKYISDQTYITLNTPFTLEAADTGSGVYSIAYRIYNATYNGGWQAFTAPFKLTSLADGTYTIEFNSTDNAGNIETTHAVSVTLDNSGPSITVENPPPGWALQDGVTFIASTSDSSGTQSLNFSIREANGDEGTPVGFENIPATYNTTTGKWELFFDTLQLPDGYYIVLVNAEDNLGHTTSIVVPYSIRNWAVLELLPATPNNKAGRTMPVKFSLRVAAAVDPSQPFVYNEELTIEIYATNNPSELLQSSTFGDTSRDYRINTIVEQYITNFQTLKTPKTYEVEIWRGNMLIGSFQFRTVT